MLGLAEPAKVALQKALASPASFAGKDEAQSYLARLTGAAPGTAGETVAQLEKIVKTQPKDLTARMRLAALYEQGGNPERAASEYEEVLRQNPRTAQAALRLGQLNAGPLQNRAKALEFARKARDLAPNDPETAALLGRLVYQTGDHAQAYSLLQPAARQLARRPEVQFDLAWAAYCVGRVREADQAMRQVLQIEPGFKQAEAARGFLAMTALQLNPQTLAQSEAQIQQQLKTDPNHAPALMCQALLWRAKGDAKAAAPLLEKLLATFPKFVPAARELGLIHAADPAQAQKAYDLLTQAREAYADDAELARALALLSYQRKDYRYASSLLQASLRTRPNDAEAMYYLGMALCQVKETASGKEQLQKAVAAGLKDPLLSEARKVLAAGNAP
jgi:Flp pilus assembly protein TadD